MEGCLQVGGWRVPSGGWVEGAFRWVGGGCFQVGGWRGVQVGGWRGIQVGGWRGIQVGGWRVPSGGWVWRGVQVGGCEVFRLVGVRCSGGWGGVGLVY